MIWNLRVSKVLMFYNKAITFDQAKAFWNYHIYLSS